MDEATLSKSQGSSRFPPQRHGASARSNGMPPTWLVQDKASFWERAEVKAYQVISVFPVVVTFGLYSYLLAFYIAVS